MVNNRIPGFNIFHLPWVSSGEETRDRKMRTSYAIRRWILASIRQKTRSYIFLVGSMAICLLFFFIIHHQSSYITSLSTIQAAAENFIAYRDGQKWNRQNFLQKRTDNDGQFQILLWTKYFDDDPLTRYTAQLTACRLYRTTNRNNLRTSTAAAATKYNEKNIRYRKNYECSITTNREVGDKSHAFVYHSPSLRFGDMPTIRPSDTFHVLVSTENPAYHPLNPSLIPFFDWTSTYSHNSTFPIPYGRFAQKQTSETSVKADMRLILASKNRTIAWVVSNCITDSGREDYVKELEKHIQVDRFGKCDSGSCPESICGERQGLDQYHFYLAFENTVCTEYLTEKVFKRMRENQVVPIVLSHSVASAILPQHSFVAIDQFPNGPRQLAAYLQQLMNDTEEYLKYFDWKKSFKIVNPTPELCQLCRHLNQIAESEAAFNSAVSELTSSRQRVADFFNGSQNCMEDYASKFIPRFTSSGLRNFLRRRLKNRTFKFVYSDLLKSIFEWN